MTNTKLFLLLGTSLSLISSVSYGSHINKEALYALPEELGRVGEGVKENSSFVIARRTSSDVAIQSYFYGSPRGLLSARDDDSDDLFYYGAGNSVPSLSREGQDEYDSKNHLLTPTLSIKRGSSSVQLASVCFITDAGHCRENEFYTGANTPDGSSGGTPGGSSGEDGDEDNWEVNNEEKCKKEGYTNEDCGETATPGMPCLYDSSYHAGCVCKPEYNQSCSGADQAGKGASCDGKYKECCSLCSAYPYTDGTIPTGHVITETCQSCTGAKYKTKCNTNSSNTGAYISCGSATGGGAVCTDDSGTYYTKCTCPTNYEFNAQTQSCVCKTNFKYTCTGTGYAGGTGTSCGNKYQTCNCASGYTWSASSGCVQCGSSFKYTCTGSNQTKPSSGCGGKYDKCNCKSGYKWKNGKCVEKCDSSYKYTCTGTGYSGGNGVFCGGKYTACWCISGYAWDGSACVKKTCSSSYKYICSGTGYAGGSGSTCDGKYTSCTCSSGYEWKNGNCQKQAQNGAQGNLYYCNGKVVAVKAPGMNFYVAMKDLGRMYWNDGYNACRNYLFCDNLKGILPSKDQLLTMYNNKSSLNSLLSTNGGTKLTNSEYWSSTILDYDKYYGVNMSNGFVTYNLDSSSSTKGSVRPVMFVW